MMTWALFGKPNQREWVPSPMQKEQFAGNDGLYSSGYKLFQAHPADAINDAARWGAEGFRDYGQTGARWAAAGRRASRRGAAAGDRMTICGTAGFFPRPTPICGSPAGATAYHAVLNGDTRQTPRIVSGAISRCGARRGNASFENLKSSTTSSDWHTLAESKGVLLLDALRREMGDDAFYAMMSDFFDKQHDEGCARGGFRGGRGIRSTGAVREMAE